MEIKKVESGRIIAFKPTTKTKKPTPIAHQAQTTPANSSIKLPNNPRYYQALNNINFANQYIAIPSFDKDKNPIALRLMILFEDEEKTTMDIKDKSKISLFMDGEDLNEGALNFFSENFKQFYRLRKEKYEKEKSILLEILNSKPNRQIRVFNPEDELKRAMKANVNSDDETYAQSLLNELQDDETKKQLAAMYLNRAEREFKKSKATTAKESLRILQLSKKADGSIDSSNLEKKINIAVLSTAYDEETQQDNFGALLEASKDKKGKINLNCLEALCKLLQAGANGEAPEVEIEMAKKIIDRHINSKKFSKTIDTYIRKLHNFEATLSELL